MKRGREFARRGQVVTERLLDHHPPSTGEQLLLREPGDHSREQWGRNLEVERRKLIFAQLIGQLGVRLLVAEVPAQVLKPRREPLPNLLVDRFSSGLYRVPRV